MKIIAHRGASGYAPENTLASFEKAISMNVKAIEFDVQMTKDGKLVVIHDFFVDRTTNGHGFVFDLNYDELQLLDAGSSFDQKFKGEKIPLFEEVLDLIPQTIDLHIELKKVMLEKRDLAGAVYQMVKEKHKLSHVIFSSFDHEVLKQLQKYDDVNIGVLLNTNLVNPIEYIKSVELKEVSINPSIVFTTNELVERAHKENLLVYSFTVNDLRLANYCETIGVDGIFTNFPDIML